MLLNTEFIFFSKKNFFLYHFGELKLTVNFYKLLQKVEGTDLNTPPLDNINETGFRHPM